MADLKQYFPMIQERKEVLEKIRESRELLTMFYSWTEEQQEEFLDFCTGVKGPRMLSRASVSWAYRQSTLTIEYLIIPPILSIQKNRP